MNTATTTIDFALGESSLGQILVALSERGVCAISLGDQAEPQIEHLLQKFPTARLNPDNAALKAILDQVLAFVESPSRNLDLTLDLRGTPFQQQVWHALTAIPLGSTSTYTTIANRIGEPTAVRAVASACAANPVALAVPCHRVITSNGSLSGYRWGVARKAELLRREALATRQDY